MVDGLAAGRGPPYAVRMKTLLLFLVTALAEILIRDFKGKWLVRFLVLLPWVAPVSLATITWLWTLDSIFSPIDWLLRQTGLIDFVRELTR